MKQQALSYLCQDWRQSAMAAGPSSASQRLFCPPPPSPAARSCAGTGRRAPQSATPRSWSRVAWWGEIRAGRWEGCWCLGFEGTGRRWAGHGNSEVGRLWAATGSATGDRRGTLFIYLYQHLSGQPLVLQQVTGDDLYLFIDNMNTCRAPHLGMNPGLKASQWQLYRAVFCFRADLPCFCHGWPGMSHCSFTQCVFEYPPKWSIYSSLLLQGWCHVKLLPSQCMFGVHHTTMHQFTVSLYSKQKARTDTKIRVCTESLP